MSQRPSGGSIPSGAGPSGAGAEALALIAAFLRFARWRAGAAAGLIALGSIFDGLGLLFLVPVIGLVMGPAQPAGRFAQAVQSLIGGYPLPWRLPILLSAFAALMLIRGVVLHLRDRTTEPLQLEFVEHVRLRFVRRLAAAGWPAVAGSNHARVLQGLSVEIHQIGVASGSALLTAVALVMLIGHCILALMLAPLAGLLAIAFAAALGLISRPFVGRSRVLGRTIIEAHMGMADGAAAFMGGLKLALAQGLEGRFVDGYAAAAASLVRDRVQFSDLKSTLRNLTSGGGAMVGVLILLAGVEVFHLPAPVLITLLVVLARMSTLAASVQQGVQQIVHSLPAYRTILTVEAGLIPPEEAANDTPDIPPTLSRDAALVFAGVDYAHEPASGRRPELSRASLAIPMGAFVGVVGPSGVGKTTFLDLAAGVLRPQSGAVYAFGRRLDGEALALHRERLAYVAQDPFLFDDTVRANLAWAAPGRSEAQMRDALESVGGARLLDRLARGLDTRIGHRGALLSAGERQRVALACALLRRPRLLLLDEATNAIDVAGEEAILKAISALRPAVTVLMVAHRAESLRLCDMILEFPDLTLRTVAAPVQDFAATRQTSRQTVRRT